MKGRRCSIVLNAQGDRESYEKAPLRISKQELMAHLGAASRSYKQSLKGHHARAPEGNEEYRGEKGEIKTKKKER